jgi:hypothetical protein
VGTCAFAKTLSGNGCVYLLRFRCLAPYVVIFRGRYPVTGLHATIFKRLTLRYFVILLITNKKFWEELNAYSPLIPYRQHGRWRVQQFFVATGTCLPSRYLATVSGVMHMQTDRSPLGSLFHCVVYHYVVLLFGRQHNSRQIDQY